jgi:hypothetical protein
VRTLVVNAAFSPSAIRHHCTVMPAMAPEGESASSTDHVAEQ